MPVRIKADRKVIGARQLILHGLSRLHVEYVYRGFVRAAFAYPVSYQRSVARHILQLDRSVRVSAELRRIDEPFVFLRPAVAHVDRGLILAGQQLHEKQIVTARDGQRPARHVLQLVKIVGDLRADARLLHVTRGVGVLGRDKILRLLALRILEPAVVVRHLGTEIVVRYRRHLRVGRGRQRNSAAPVNRLARSHRSQPQRQSKTRKKPHANRIRVAED